VNQVEKEEYSLYENNNEAIELGKIFPSKKNWGKYIRNSLLQAERDAICLPCPQKCVRYCLVGG
jgi:hypothetical protein